MGTVGSSVGVEAAEKFTESTYEVIEKLKIQESAKNLTEVFQKLLNPPRPFELKITIDISDNVIQLAEKLLYFIPATLLLFLFLLVIIWRVCKFCFPPF